MNGQNKKIPKLVKFRGAKICILTEKFPVVIRTYNSPFFQYLYSKIIQKFALTNGKYSIIDINKYVYDLTIKFLGDKYGKTEKDIKWNV